MQPLEAVTTSVLSLALDATTRRQQAVAANLANLHTEGYTPLALSFEAQLEDARSSLRERGRVNPATLAGVQPVLEPRLDEHGQAIVPQLDLELAEMARNAVHHQALAQALSRHLLLLSMAAGDGRK